MQNSLSSYPTISWGSKKSERWSSKIHYFGRDGKTLCGKHIPKNRPLGDSWDMCERCAKLLVQKEKG